MLQMKSGVKSLIQKTSANRSFDFLICILAFFIYKASESPKQNIHLWLFVPITSIVVFFVAQSSIKITSQAFKLLPKNAAISIFLVALLHGILLHIHYPGFITSEDLEVANKIAWGVPEQNTPITYNILYHIIFFFGGLISIGTINIFLMLVNYFQIFLLSDNSSERSNNLGAIRNLLFFSLPINQWISLQNSSVTFSTFLLATIVFQTIVMIKTNERIEQGLGPLFTIGLITLADITGGFGIITSAVVIFLLFKKNRLSKRGALRAFLFLFIGCLLFQMISINTQSGPQQTFENFVSKITPGESLVKFNTESSQINETGLITKTVNEIKYKFSTGFFVLKNFQEFMKWRLGLFSKSLYAQREFEIRDAIWPVGRPSSIANQDMWPQFATKKYTQIADAHLRWLTLNIAGSHYIVKTFLQSWLLPFLILLTVHTFITKNICTTFVLFVVFMKICFVYFSSNLISYANLVDVFYVCWCAILIATSIGKKLECP